MDNDAAKKKSMRDDNDTLGDDRRGNHHREQQQEERRRRAKTTTSTTTTRLKKDDDDDADDEKEKEKPTQKRKYFNKSGAKTPKGEKHHQWVARRSSSQHHPQSQRHKEKKRNATRRVAAAAAAARGKTSSSTQKALARKRRVAEKYRRENSNNNNNNNTIATNTELDSMRPGERIVKAMENISAFDKYGGASAASFGTTRDEKDDDDEEFYEPINFDLVEVDSTEVERLYASLERDPTELSPDDEFKDLLLEHSVDNENDSGSISRQRRRYSSGANNSSSASRRANAADVFHLKDVARAVINPSSSLAQHNLDEKNAKIEKDPNHKFGTSTINFAIKELGDKNDFSRAYALYRWMSTQAFNDESKYSPNAYTFCALASSAKASREVRIVLEVWRGELKIAKHRNTTATTTGGRDNNNNNNKSSLSSSAAEKGELDFDSSQSWLARNECASAAIAMTTKIGDWQSALEIFNDVKKIGNVKRNIYTYTAILTALRDSGKAEEAEAVLYEMLEERNVRVTSLAFSLALGAFEVARMWQEGNKLAKSAFEVFQIDSPDATLTHAIITMAGRAGDLQFASETFENMKNSTLVVTTYSYNALLGGYARYGDWENANRVFSDLRRAHLQPDRYTYTQLISAAERAGEYEAADVVWREMLTKSRHVVPHTVMCGAYIHCLARQRRNLEADDVLETMKARWDVPRNAAVYNALIGAHVRAGDVPRALRVYDRMQVEDNIMATEITFAVLIRACQEDGEFVKMADLLQQAKELLAREGKLAMDLTGGGGRAGSLF